MTVNFTPTCPANKRNRGSTHFCPLVSKDFESFHAQLVEFVILFKMWSENVFDLFKTLK